MAETGELVRSCIHIQMDEVGGVCVCIASQSGRQLQRGEPIGSPLLAVRRSRSLPQINLAV